MAQRGIEYGEDSFDPVSLSDMDYVALREMGVHKYCGKVYVSIERHPAHQGDPYAIRVFMGREPEELDYSNAEIFGFEDCDKILMTLGETERRVKLKDAMKAADWFINGVNGHREVEERQAFLGVDRPYHEVLWEREF